MLVLSRQKDEEVVIQTSDGPIVVKLVDLRGDKARLGFSAPDAVRVDRREVYDAIRREAREGGKATS